MNLPSVKTLDRAFPGHGKALRLLLESQAAVDAHPAVVAWERECYHRPGAHDRLMWALNAEAGTCGVEFIPRGRGARSPAFEYLNTGDTYTLTICRPVSGVEDGLRGSATQPPETPPYAA